MAKKANGHTNGQGHNSGSLWRTRVYNVIEYDPEIDRFQQLWQQEKLYREADLAMLAGISGSTVHNMFNGKTRRPQHATFAKMAGAMGFSYSLVREGDAPDYVNEIPKARAEFKSYKKALAKKKARKR